MGRVEHERPGRGSMGREGEHGRGGWSMRGQGGEHGK